MFIWTLVSNHWMAAQSAVWLVNHQSPKSFAWKIRLLPFCNPIMLWTDALKLFYPAKCNENVSVNLTVKLMTKITDLVNYWLKWSETLTGLCVTAPPRWRCCLLGRTSTEVPSWWTCRRPWATRPEFRPAGRDCSRWEMWPTNLHTLIFTLQVIKLKLMNTERYYQLLLLLEILLLLPGK